MVSNSRSFASIATRSFHLYYHPTRPPHTLRSGTSLQSAWGSNNLLDTAAVAVVVEWRASIHQQLNEPYHYRSSNRRQQIRWKSDNTGGRTSASEVNGGGGDLSSSSVGRSGGGNSTVLDSLLKKVRFEDVNAILLSSSNNGNHAASVPTETTTIIDVREPAELSTTGIIPGAICIPLNSQPDAFFLLGEEFETRFGFPKPAAQSLIFYCKLGVRARAAAQLAVQAGYDPARISVYRGSWVDWVDRGGKVEKWKG